MLCVLVLSVTPKRFLHDIVTHHIHSYSQTGASNGEQLTIASYHCNCDDVVVASPFVEACHFILILPSNLFVTPNLVFNSGFISFNSVFASLRGPPIIS